MVKVPSQKVQIISVDLSGYLLLLVMALPSSVIHPCEWVLRDHVGEWEI